MIVDVKRCRGGTFWQFNLRDRWRTAFQSELRKLHAEVCGKSVEVDFEPCEIHGALFHVFYSVGSTTFISDSEMRIGL